MSAWAFPGSCSAAGAVVCGGAYVLVTPIIRGDICPCRLLGGSVAWPGGGGLLAGHGSAPGVRLGPFTWGSFGGPLEKVESGMRVEENSKEGAWGWAVGKDLEGSGGWTEPGGNGNRGNGGWGRMSRWVEDICPRPGLSTNVEGVVNA